MDEFDDELDDFSSEEIQEESSIQQTSTTNTDDELLNDLLRSKGIEDKSRINIENYDGSIEEQDWDSLSKSDKLNILQSDFESNTDLDEDEIAFLNTIRSQGMTPQDFIRFSQQTAVNNYVQNQTIPRYQVDDIEDDVLYASDIIARVGNENISDDEIRDLLDKAKEDPNLYKKQVQAIRNEYKQLEDNNNAERDYQIRQNRIQQFNQFAETVENEIRNFRNFHGYDLNMSEDEMEEIYDFITGSDAAGINHFAKALNDPKLLVQAGWWLLHGKDAIEDINSYWISELKKSRRGNSVEIRPRENKSSVDDFDLDDF